jgi:archaemetzincin
MRKWNGGNARYILLVFFLAALVLLFLSLPGIETEGTHSRARSGAGNIIYIQPLGKIDAAKLGMIHEILNENFDRDVRILPSKPLPKRFRVAERGQYDANLIMRWAEENMPADTYRHITVVGEDIFSERCNFIFGEARIRGKSALVSLYRFTDPSKPPGDEPLFRERITKLLLHELGHTFGLQHCENKHCVMAFANSLRELDMLSSSYCDECRKKLGNMSVLSILSGSNDTVIYTELAPDMEK